MPKVSLTSIPVEVLRTRLADTDPELSPGTGLEVKWSGGEQTFFDSRSLRMNCPCAACLEERGKLNHSRPFSAPQHKGLTVLKASVEQETNLAAVWPVGNYALGLRWGDLHDSGIYSFELLRELAELVP